MKERILCFGRELWPLMTSSFMCNDASPPDRTDSPIDIAVVALRKDFDDIIRLGIAFPQSLHSRR